jgi:uncharacterized protein with von Willebrand factor type A (vWA) domain
VETVYQDFVKALRNNGVRVSTAETLDGARVLGLVGYGDRVLLRDGLAAALAKSEREKQVLWDCFDRFFSTDELPPSTDVSPDAYRASSPELSSLSRLLLMGDGGGLSLAMRTAAQEVDISAIRFFTQKGVYAQRVLQAMGVEELEVDIRRFSDDTTADGAETAEALKASRDRLQEVVRDFVEQQYRLFAGKVPEQIVERYLKQVSLSNVDHADMDRMRKIIQKMVKRLNDRHSRRRKRSKRGHLDVKGSLRKNQAYHGLIFEPCWKSKKLDRPDLMVLCDVSRSVQAFSRFMLFFLYSLNQELARIRSFIFCSNLVEVSRVFEEFDVEAALDHIRQGSHLGLMLGSTDYGRAFQDLRRNGLDRIGKATTVLILGDARNNYGDPRADLLEEIRNRSKRIIWLNPEPVVYWGTGDSEMNRYLPYCFLAKQCSTLTHLERVVDFLLGTRL